MTAVPRRGGGFSPSPPRAAGTPGPAAPPPRGRGGRAGGGGANRAAPGPGGRGRGVGGVWGGMAAAPAFARSACGSVPAREHERNDALGFNLFSRSAGVGITGVRDSER